MTHASTEIAPKEWLYEISFMRPILLLMLVSYHAFAPWCGTWDMPEGCTSFEPYRWIALLSRAFRLECFVFISGYIFTFQMLKKNKFPTFKELLSSKIVRLLIPCWFFSVIYFACFKHYTNIIDFLIVTGGGIGHLWYLPCLFVCFLVQWLLIKKNCNTTLVLTILSLLVFVSVIPLPLNMSRPLYYMLFFYGGGLFYQNKDKIDKKSTHQSIIVSWIVFVLVLIGVNLVNEVTMGAVCNSLLKRGSILGMNAILKASLAWVGIYAFYTSAVIWCRNHQVSNWALKIGVCGYGVYVFHQFVLTWFYDYTSLPLSLGTYWTPWVAFVIATGLSLVLTLLIRQTKMGKMFL